MWGMGGWMRAPVRVCGCQMAALSGPKTQDGKQGELSGTLQSMGYTSSQVFKF